MNENILKSFKSTYSITLRQKDCPDATAGSEAGPIFCKVDICSDKITVFYGSLYITDFINCF